MATFFQANGYFQIKSDETLTVPDTQDFKNLEKLETEGYERAKNRRQEILKEVSSLSGSKMPSWADKFDRSSTHR
jgi:E3 ubiquitin-protein ligase SHPRH